MPRLDNSSELPAQFFPTFCHPTDVEKRTVIDLCQDCWRAFWFNYEIDHPPYEDVLEGETALTCVKCGAVLTEEDNNAPLPGG